MRKQDERRIATSCLNRATEQEMLFVLLGRDHCAPAAIRYWCGERIRTGKNLPTDYQILEALKCADAMERDQEIQCKEDHDAPTTTHSKNDQL
jgi:hypothetical protein